MSSCTKESQTWRDNILDNVKIITRDIAKEGKCNNKQW